MRNYLRTHVHEAMVGLGVASLARNWNSESVAILSYHNVVPDHETPRGEKSLHLAQSEFGRQLDLLAESHEVVGLDELSDGGSSDRVQAAITFDDGYHGAVSAGLAELVSRDLPATYFVSPNLLGRTIFWWDAIAAAHSGTLPDNIRQAAHSECNGCQARVMRWARRNRIDVATVPEHCRSARVAEVREAAREAGITLGSHTWSHPDLSRIDPESIRSEVRRSRKWLTEEMTSVIPWVAYPYGIPPARDSIFSPTDEAFAVTTEGTLANLSASRLDRRRIPRINIPSGLSLARFELLTSGL